MPVFIGQEVRDAGPHCKGHPTQPIAFHGDRCYKCRIFDSGRKIVRFKINWTTVEILAYAAIMAALLGMAFSSAFATWCKINLPGGIQ